MSLWNNSKIVAYLQLIRLPNIFTAMADITAGYLLICSGQINFLKLFGLLVATSAIYGAGCVYNDFCDLKIDRVERPFRPISSGKISSREAAVLASILFIIGLTGAAFAGFQAFIIAVILVILVILYDRLTKDVLILGSLNMAACRALNLILGMSTIVLEKLYLLFPAITLVYIFFLTTFSKFEVNGRLLMAGWVAFIGVISVLLFLLLLVMKKVLGAAALFYICIMFFCILPALTKVVFHPSPKVFGQAVKIMILSIPFLDAVYVSGVHGVQYGIPVALCVIPAILTSRYLYVT